MTAQQALWIFLGCFVSVALDWAIYERVSASLEVLRPRRIRKPYSQLSHVRKLGIAFAGGLVVASVVMDQSFLLWLGLVCWLLLHAPVYITTAASSERKPDAS